MLRLLTSLIVQLYFTLVRCWFRLLWAFSGPTKFLLPPIEDPALVQTACTLALWIRERKRSAESIVKAFQKRALAVNHTVHAIVDDRFEAALSEAREVDKKLNACTPEQREEMGRAQPLLGVPFTSKENVMIQGLSHTHGILRRRGMKAAHDAEVVRRLREAGAIPLAVTNVPELGMWYESANLLYGRTTNPYDISRTPGGSSGGESALLASCGTPLSIGTDLAGSIRLPAALCGLFGHKPTSGWVPLDGCGIFPDTLKDRRALVAGPLCRSVGDLVMFLETVVGSRAEGLAAKVAATDIRNLKIWWADSMDSPWCPATEPSLREALHAARLHLEHTFRVITCKFQWPVDMANSAVIWATKLAFESKGKPPLASDLKNREGTANMMKEWLLCMCGLSEHTFATIRLISTLPNPRCKKFNEPQLNWKNVQKQFMDILGKDSVLLVPVHSMTACYHKEPLFYSMKGAEYCYIFNATEMPGTTVPLGLSKDGLPLALQVVTTPENDHLSLAVAAALEEKFGGWVSPSPIKV